MSVLSLSVTSASAMGGSVVRICGDPLVRTAAKKISKSCEIIIILRESIAALMANRTPILEIPISFSMASSNN